MWESPLRPTSDLPPEGDHRLPVLLVGEGGREILLPSEERVRVRGGPVPGVGVQHAAQGAAGHAAICKFAMKFFIVFRVKLRKWSERGKVFLIVSQFNENFIIILCEIRWYLRKEFFLCFLTMSKRKQNIHIFFYFRGADGAAGHAMYKRDAKKKYYFFV